MSLKTHHFFYLFVGFGFLAIAGGSLFSEGMFVDGLLYATIARNMAEGLGNFWQPHLSETLFSNFYEHPPLALGIQSIAFQLFGDSIYVERCYSLATFLVAGFVVVKIWTNLTDNWRSGWLPLLLWTTVNTATWATANNMLENTMTIFVLLAFLFFQKSTEKHSNVWLLLSGVSLALAFLTKGPFGLYIWVAPALYWVFYRKSSMLKAAYQTIILVFSTVLPLMALYVFVPAAQNNFYQYFNKQVVKSIDSVVTVNSRFAIVGDLFSNSIIALLFAILVFIVAKRSGINRAMFTKNLRTTWLFLSIALCGVLPIMISLKQRGFYILSVFPFVAIGLAYWIYPILKPQLALINPKSTIFRVFKITTLALILFSISNAFTATKKVGRDEALIADTKKVLEVVGRNSTLNICPEMYDWWSAHGYFARYGNISLDAKSQENQAYYLAKKGCKTKFNSSNYQLLSVGLQLFDLYVLIAADDSRARTED